VWLILTSRAQTNLRAAVALFYSTLIPAKPPAALQIINATCEQDYITNT
jgi:hypothetical protein